MGWLNFRYNKCIKKAYAENEYGSDAWSSAVNGCDNIINRGTTNELLQKTGTDTRVNMTDFITRQSGAPTGNLIRRQRNVRRNKYRG